MLVACCSATHQFYSSDTTHPSTGRLNEVSKLGYLICMGHLQVRCETCSYDIIYHSRHSLTLNMEYKRLLLFQSKINEDRQCAYHATPRRAHIIIIAVEYQ